MNIYTFSVKQPYKNYILKWIKTIEGRLNKWKFKKLKIGDILQFETWEKFLVKWKRYYKTFKEMLLKENINKVLPNVESIDKGVKVYYNFYTPAQEKQYWVIAIEIEKIN